MSCRIIRIMNNQNENINIYFFSQILYLLYINFKYFECWEMRLLKSFIALDQNSRPLQLDIEMVLSSMFDDSLFPDVLLALIPSVGLSYLNTFLR